MRGENMNNDQLRAMYNIYGTLNRPQSYEDDLYNDRENMMPSAGQELTQTGTDEAGNPVMAPAEAPEAPRQEQAPLNNLIDFARSRMEQSLDNGSYITAGAGVWAPVVEGMRDLWNATPEERAQMLNVPQRMENAVRGVIHGMSNATELEHTQLYENYFYNPQRKNDEINRISKLLQIDGNAFANDRELYQKAALAADRVERMGKFKKYQDAQGNIDMAKIYADIPGLADIQKQQGTAAAALALGNIDGVRSINDVYNNAFTRFVGSVYAGARRGWISDRRSSIWNDARKENRLPNAEEQKELDAYDAELRELPKYNYNTVGNVAGAMVGGAMENMAMIVKSQGAGALAGLAAGRVGGVRAASIARNAASTYVMSQMIAGNQYEELVNRTDVNGRPMYTPEQASWLALAQGAGEAVLEQYSLTQIGKAIFGRSAAKSITEIIKNSPTLEAAKAGVREYASTKIREATKAGLISLGAEAAEEFNQAASDMLMENVAQVMINGKDAELSSIDDILTNSTGQMLEALPAIGGFGLIGFGAHPVANTRAVLGFRSHVRDVVNNKILIGRMANAHYSEVLNGVWDNKKNIKELQDKAPEVAQTILDAQNKIAGIESGFVDVRALRQQEGGEALVQDIAERNNISADELAACLDGSGMLQVKTSTLMQMDLQDAERKAIMDNVTTSLDAFTEAQTKEAVKLAQDQMKSLQNFNDKTYKAAVDNIIAARFPDAEQAKLAREIIETNYDNPQEEFKRRLDAVNAEINEEIEPVLRELRSGMKQGVVFGRDAEGYATGQRISNNDPWYSNWYADHGRAPNKRELENLAIDIASGRQDPRYGLPTYQNNTDESREYYAGVAEKLDNLEEQRDALEAIQERMRDLNPGEMVATASLSKEGLKVYDAMRRMMGESENADVQKAGRFNALFLARYADNMAKVFSKVRNAPYTAEDFVRDRFRIDVNAEYNEEQMAAQLFQVSPEEFAKQKEAVRKQYENTDQWLKAPNGKDTNLTEDQWVTVRTPAFKNWFGDWEGNPAEASKVVDENGEPLVVYHKTDTMEPFDTFRTSNEWGYGGAYFSDVRSVAERLGRNKDAHVYEVFLNIRNPIDVNADFATYYNIERPEEMPPGGTVDTQEIINFARQNGNDGAIVRDVMESTGAGTDYIATEPNQIKDATGRNVGFDPTSNNIYYQTSTQIAAKYPNWMDNQVVADEDSKKGQTTQIAGTVKTYEKVGNFIKSKLPKDAKILDASSGMGLGTLALRDIGIDVEDIEPYPGGDRMKTNPPTFYGVDAYEQARRSGKQYDYIISNAVLNVIPDDWRQSVLHDMASLLKVGGQMFINVRKKGEEKNIKNKIELDSPQEVLVGTPERIVSYQRFFTPKELADYVKSELGAAYEVTIANESNSGTKGLPAVVVTKKYNAPDTYYQQTATTLFQEAMPERDLVAYHNMSENSVLRSAALGGLPVPSIAVTRQDIPFDQFGEITLIGGSDIVDPANNSANEIFSRDAWTVTFPKTVYDKIKTKDVNNLLNTFKSSFNALGDEGRREASELDYILNGDPSIDNAKYNLSNQLGVMYHYVTQVLGKPVKVPFEKVKGRYDYLLKHKEISDMVKEMRYDYFQNDEMKARFSNAVRPYIEAEMKKEHGEDAAKYVKVFFTEEGYFSRNLFDNLTYELRDYGKTKLNDRKLKAELRKKIKEADYEKFIDEQISTLYKNPQIMVGKKRMPITLDNIVAAMSALRGAGKQESLTYGDNKALAAMSKKFKSLDELRKKKSNLTTQEKANLAVQIYKEKADAYREVVGGHYKWKDSWDKWDDANKALVMAAKKGGSESAIRTALLRNDFENIDNAVIDAAKEVINAAKDMQTDYFEAKPLRAVGFNEFAAAVVPNGTSKETIDYLKSQGIAVTKYNPKIEGDRQAKTQKAAQKANVYFQQSRGAKGSLSLNQQGQRIINLFESADQSTFVHEMSHMFLLDLQEVAGIDPNSQQAKDLKTIMDWAEYKPGQADEYKGTASAEEFRRREADIQAAEKAGNTLEARRLKDIWAQERFARGFEEYLKSGEAPAAGLKRAFRQFKKWLVQIYNDVLGAGVRATPEVEAIMARMVASEDEIEAMAAANNIARLQKVDPDILSEDAQALRDRWQEEAKERAKEKMLRELMKQYEQQNLKDLDKRLEDVRTSAREELQEMPYFVCEQLLADGTDMASALEICGYDSEQEYRAALKEAGGGMEKALDKMVAQARENMLKEMPSKDALYTMAEEALLSGDYNTRLATLEAEMLKAREASYRNAPARLRRALTEVDEAIKNFETQAVRQAVQKLKYAERWGTKDLQTIQELEKHLADLDKADAKKEEKQKVKEQFEAKYRELKQRTVQNEQWLRDVRDATDGKLKAMRIMARAQMANQQLSAATNPRHWHRQALSEGKKAWQEISRAQRKGEEVNARQAVRAKETQAYFDAMTAEAIKNRQKVDRMLNNARGIKARGKRMADPKFKADANLRYFHNHLLYVYGLRNSDAIAPAQEKTFTDVLAELRASHQFEEEVPAWLIAAAEATTQEKNYQQLTLGEFEELDKLTKVLYTLAKNQNQLLTLDVDMDTVVADCGTDWMNHVDYEVGNQRINEVKGAIGDYMNGLLKPEVLLSIMGGKDGGFIKYIYRVLFKAAEAEEIAREKEAAAQKALYSHYYTQQELRAMVNDPVMVDGPDGKKVKLQIGDDTDITKENLICMALNWGNEANRARLVVGLFDCENETELAQKQAELMDVLAHTLTEKDWQFVQAMWDHINTFANPVSEVLEKSVGVPLDRVKADAFSVDLPDGQQLNMAGGYYPIVKDSGKSSRQSEFNQLEEAKAVGGVSVFGTGMSATKARTDNLFLNQGPLKLTLDVAHKHIQAQIHLIHAKMAVRDAYKVLNNKAIKDMIRRTCGEGTVKTMNEWVLNCWAPPVRPHSWYESIAASLRSKTVGAIMGYRVSTALLNLANVVYMAQEIGTKNALSAMADFYRHPMENRQAILDVSVFMRNRATNMDRDLGAQEEQFLKRHNMVGNAIDKATGGKSEEMRYLMDKYANWLIEQTDMLVSMPLYQWQFKETYSAEIAKGVPEEEARETANFEATRRVTKVFGSSRALDSSSVQRSKNEIVKLITPFFTFANTMMNAVWSHYYEGKYTADKKTFSRRYAAFARAMLFNFVLGALVETMLRQVPDMLAGSGGDDDDDKFMKDVGKNVIANAVAGFPGVNEFINTTYELFTEKKNYGSGRGVGVLSGSVERAQKVIQDMAKITHGGDKIDAIDFFRDVARAANVKTGMSDTITDAVFNTVRFAADGYSLDNMDDLREYIAKTLFDRKLKKK